MNTIAKTANHAIFSGSSRFHLSTARVIATAFPRSLWAILLLLTAVFLSAIAIIDIQVESRYLYADLQNLERARDLLNVQWAQLLLEKNTLVTPVHVQEIAENQLGMVFPKETQIIIVHSSAK